MFNLSLFQIKSSLDTEYFLPIYFRRKLCKKQDVIKKELNKTQQFIVKYLKIQKNYFLPSILKKYQENKIDDTDVEDVSYKAYKILYYSFYYT